MSKPPSNIIRELKGSPLGDAWETAMEYKVSAGFQQAEPRSSPTHYAERARRYRPHEREVATQALGSRIERYDEREEQKRQAKRTAEDTARAKKQGAAQGLATRLLKNGVRPEAVLVYVSQQHGQIGRDAAIKIIQQR